MNKYIKIFLIIFGVILLISLIAGFFIYKNITSSNITTAALYVQEGQVSLNDKLVTSRVLLNEGDKIETKMNSKAKVILYESIVIQLEENTSIELEDLINKHPKVNQKTGNTWNQFTKLSGVEEYSISYGESVASVRGTGFLFSENKIITGEGAVNYFASGESFNVSTGEVVEKVFDQFVLRNMTAEEKSKVSEFLEKSIADLRELRTQEILKNSRIYSMAKSQLKMSDEEINKKLMEFDENNEDLRSLADKSPIKIDSLYRVVDITEKIREIKSAQKNIQLNSN